MKPSTRLSYLAIAFTCAALCLCVIACATDDADTKTSTGRMSLPLMGISDSGTIYQLVDGDFSVTAGDTAVASFSSNDYLGMASADIVLEAASYMLTLANGWTLQQQLDDGTFEPVEAELISDNPLPVTIAADAVTQAVFLFEVDGQIIIIGDGTLSVSIDVVESEWGEEPPPPVQNGQLGTTTRYWDCCKPHCAWAGNSPTPVESCDINDNSFGTNFSEPNACSGGTAFACSSLAPWAVGSRFAYGYVATNSGSCGDCYQVDFTGDSDDPGAAALADKTMIVQAVSIGDLGTNQFDLLVPGGGVGAFNGCSTQWGDVDLGAQYGGYLTECQGIVGSGNHDAVKDCVRQACELSLGSRPDFLAGCEWFVDWFEAANNPTMVYAPTECPAALLDVSSF